MSGPFEPKRYTYKHHQKRLRHLRGENNKALTLFYGTLGCQIQDSLVLTSKKKESLRLLVLRLLRKMKIIGSKVYWRFACNIPQTQKSANARMGSGVGGLENWIAKLKSQSIIFEISNIDTNASYFNNMMETFKTQIGAWFPTKISWIY